jgi:ankyrin repeat protein
MKIFNTMMISMILPVMAVSCDHRREMPAAGVQARTTKTSSQTTLDREILFRENGRVKDHYFGYTPLILAARTGDAAGVEAELAKGADINWKMQWGLTALMWAADQGHAPVVKLLLDRGADIDAQNEDGLTALMLAAREGRTDVVSILLERGAKINIKDHANKTACDWAKENENGKIVELIGECR